MSSNFYDIPFRFLSSDSDFICKDGELLSMTGLTVNDRVQKSPPSPDIEFALVRDILKGWHPISTDFPSKTLVASDPSMEYWTGLASQLLSQFKYDAGSQGLFVSPFYVLAAWKTKDGNYMSPSQPALMIPNSVVPPVAIDDNISSAELQFRIAGAVCRLYFKISTHESLRDWVAEIESLEILVSNSLIRFDNFISFLPSKLVSTDNTCVSLNLITDAIEEEKVCTTDMPLAWTPSSSSLIPEGHYPESQIKSLKFYPFASIPLNQVDIADSWGPAGIRGIGDFIYGSIGEGLKYQSLTPENREQKISGTCILRGTDSDFTLTTRPIKLSVATALKRIKRIFLRGNYEPSKILINVYGSRDMLKWWHIAKGQASVVGLPLSYFRFYKVEIKGYLSSAQTLEGISLL